jgi:hypothetical protein
LIAKKYCALIEKVGKALDTRKFSQMPQRECAAGRERARARLF